MKNAASTQERKKFQALVGYFQKYGQKYDVDWLLMAAQGYQESQLNQQAQSHVGAIGVMQLMPATGKEMKVGDIRETEANIHAGVKYMRWMIDNYYGNEPMTKLDKALFSFASYNAGAGRVSGLRKEAAKRGLNPNVWFHNVEYVAAEKIGAETVTYVANIYKYYVAYRPDIGPAGCKSQRHHSSEEERTVTSFSRSTTGAPFALALTDINNQFAAIKFAPGSMFNNSRKPPVFMMLEVPMAPPFARFTSLLVNALFFAAGSPVSGGDVLSGPPNLPLADCGLEAAHTAYWRASRTLDEAARRWALGADLNDAVARSGYPATAVSGLRFYGLDAPDRPRLNAASCRVLRDRSLHDVGAFRRADELWVVFAAQAVLPNVDDAAAVAHRALNLVNEARGRGHRCGNRSWPTANPVRLSAKLSEIARQHALDMAQHHYFDHQDLSGRSPAARVKAAGYRDRRIAENIAYGTLSTEDAIAGWLDSPGHCENLMDPRFKEMGIAFAPAGGDHGELYWVQLFADPK